jgi:hypothetical protein
MTEVGHIIRDLFARVVEDAVWNCLTRGFLAANATLALSPDTDDVRQQIRKDSTKWSTLIAKRTQRYTEQEFCLVSNPNIFAEAFIRAYHITERFSADAFVKGLVQPWAPSSVYECFVLSKIEGNMSWHVDGGSRVASDIVVYNVLGPSDSVSCFMLLVVDTMQLLQAQLTDPSFPTCEEIDAGLIQLDERKIPLETPDLTGCEATFCGLMRKPELNNIRVEVIEVHDDGRYVVQHGGQQSIVHPRNLQFDSGYCELPDEIAFVVPRLSVAVQKAVAAGVVRCRFIWAREGDVVVFDGSKPHAVFNVASATGLPQLALAVNYRGVMPRVEQHMKRKKGVRLKSVAFKY